MWDVSWRTEGAARRPCCPRPVGSGVGLLAGYACTATRRGEGACVEDMIDEGPDLVDFVLSEQAFRALNSFSPAHTSTCAISPICPGPQDSQDGPPRRGRE